MLILEDSVMAALARRAAITSEFPFLRPAADAVGCRCRVSVDFNAIKAAVASLGDAGRARLKQLVPADRIRVAYRDAAGKVQVVEF